MASIASGGFCSLVTEQDPESSGILENPRLGETGCCCWGMAFFLRTECCSEIGGITPSMCEERFRSVCQKGLRPQALSDVCAGSVTGKREFLLTLPQTRSVLSCRRCMLFALNRDCGNCEAMKA